jgi:hypothetical protein
MQVLTLQSYTEFLGQLAGFFEHCNELLDFMRGEFLLSEPLVSYLQAAAAVHPYVFLLF